MKYLNGIDAVPVRHLSAPQQKMDGSSVPPARGCGVAVNLPVVPAFGMRGQFERTNHLVGSLSGHLAVPYHAPDSAVRTEADMPSPSVVHGFTRCFET